MRIGRKAKEMRAVWFEKGIIHLIDQRLLPSRMKIFKARDYRDVAFAIKDMVVRGAPAIGVTAAYGMAQAQQQKRDMELVSKVLKATRPTAYDLFFTVDHMLKEKKQGNDLSKVAEDYCERIVDECRRIGDLGEHIIRGGARILTHCNAGALATVDHGTALAPIRAAHRNGKKLFVLVDETRPRLQGAKLTSWELRNEGIEHAVIADNAAGFYMERGEIDIAFVGADRIASNGDVANKIGTYEKAVLAHENDVPFYICAPLSTFDFNLQSGKDIPIEERAGDEVRLVGGHRIMDRRIKVKNPAFDVTPARYVTGIITPEGTIRPDEVRSLRD